MAVRTKSAVRVVRALAIGTFGVSAVAVIAGSIATNSKVQTWTLWSSDENFLQLQAFNWTVIFRADYFHLGDAYDKPSMRRMWILRNSVEMPDPTGSSWLVEADTSKAESGWFLLVLPTWSLALVFGAGLALTARVPLRAWSRSARGVCIGCGYSLRGNVSGICPECGRPCRREEGCRRLLKGFPPGRYARDRGMEVLVRSGVEFVAALLEQAWATELKSS